AVAIRRTFQWLHTSSTSEEQSRRSRCDLAFRIASATGWRLGRSRDLGGRGSGRSVWSAVSLRELLQLRFGGLSLGLGRCELTRQFLQAIFSLSRGFRELRR